MKKILIFSKKMLGGEIFWKSKKKNKKVSLVKYIKEKYKDRFKMTNGWQKSKILQFWYILEKISKRNVVAKICFSRPAFGDLFLKSFWKLLK